MSELDSIVVVDAQRQFVESVSPAIARYALRAERATVLYKNPFTIQLNPGVLRTPRPRRGTDSASGPEVVRINKQMALSPTARAHLITEYFKEERDQVWVKAITDAQVVLTIKEGSDFIKVPYIEPGDPVLLTTYCSFEVLKKAPDLRNMVMKGRLKLMTADEASTFFDAKAERLGTSPDAIKNQSFQRQQEYLNHEPLAMKAGMDVIHDTRSGTEEQNNAVNPVLIKDRIKPKVYHLCRQSSAALPADQRKPANELQEEFLAIEESLDEDNLQYILANVGHKTIRDWAEGRIQALDIARG